MSTLADFPGVTGATRRRVVTLMVVAVAFAGMGTVAAPRAEAAGLGCEVDPGWATMKSAWATEVVALTNAHRATLGLQPLTPSRTLTDAAEWKAAHMANYGYMSHDDPAPPVDRSWDQRIEDCGYTYGMGENIAFGYRSPADVVQGWIDSEGHRRNIENPDFVVIGVGAAVNSDDTPYWAQTFGTHLDSPVEEAPTPIEQAEVVSEVVEEQLVDHAVEASDGTGTDVEQDDTVEPDPDYVVSDAHGEKSWSGSGRWTTAWNGRRCASVLWCGR